MSTWFLRRLRKLGPHGGARCIPVVEYLEARARGALEVEQQFYEGLLLPNGVYRTTTTGRMDDLLPLLVERARGLSPAPLRILDVACSSGVSTVEMHRAFEAAGIPCETWGSDLILEADYVRREDGVGMLFDPEGRLLQIEIGAWASPWKWRPRDLALRPWLSLRARRLVRRDAETFRASRTQSMAGYQTRRVSFLSSLAESGGGVRFAPENILSPRIPGSFGVIRAANILNRGYFDAATLRRMAAALCARLVPGGLLLAVRTEGPQATNRATLFRRRPDGLDVLDRVNGGSEVEVILTGACGEGVPALPRKGA